MSAPEPVPAYTPPAGAPQIVFVDAALIVLNKAAGLLSVPGRGAALQDCLATRVQALYPEARIVHRLDMATSGLIVMARGAAMERRLSIAFQQRQVGKRYVAVLAGRLNEAAGDIALPLIADWPNRPRQKVCLEQGKPALTHYVRLAYDAGSDTSRVALFPHTGRSHQLRVHMQALGHPILGDALYAPAEVAGAAPRLLLHAEALSLAQPHSGEVLELVAPAPF